MKHLFLTIKKMAQWTLRVSICAVVAFYTLSLLKRSCMQLIHKQTGFVVAEEKTMAFAVKDPFLRKDLEINGITIPAPLRAQYEGKSVVKMSDPLFPKAFKEVYMKLHMKEGLYEWREEPPST